MNDFVIHPAAQAEYEQAADWYAERSAKTAQRFVSEVEAAIEAIWKQSDSYARLDETHRLYLLNRFSYYLAYRLKNWIGPSRGDSPFSARSRGVVGS